MPRLGDREEAGVMGSGWGFHLEGKGFTEALRGEAALESALGEVNSVKRTHGRISPCLVHL